MFIKAMLRLLCALVDWIIVMFACQIVLIGLFNVPMNIGFTAQTFFMIVYCIYNGLFTRYMHGQTPGKAVGRLAVIDSEFPPEEKQKPAMNDLILRESCKALFFFPIVGWLVGLVTIIILLLGYEPLHDRVGKTTVIFIKRSINT